MRNCVNVARAVVPLAFAAASSCALMACSGSRQNNTPKQTQSSVPVAAAPIKPLAPPTPPLTLATKAPVRGEVPLEADSGTFVIPVTINDAISLKFMIDSGASDVTIPSDVASTLVRAGTISADDYIGSQTFVLADGSEVPSPEFRIRSLRVGPVVLHDIVASITGSSGSLLLGQTFLRRLKSWSIDNSRHVLLLEANTSETQLTTPFRQASDSQSQETASATGPLVTNSEEIVRRFYSAWSDKNDPDGLSIGVYFGDPVTFYGKQLDLNELMSKQIVPFARRWPVRSYTPESSSIRTNCSTETHLCVVKGVLDWNVSNPARLRRSSGTAQFSLTLADGRIVEESGKVLSRGR